MLLRLIKILSTALSFTIILGAWINEVSADPLDVFVSILPQKAIVQHIGKDLVSVQVMVSPGVNPATYEPKPGQMARLSHTRLYFSVGVPFENAWLPRFAAANPKMVIVPSDQGIKKLPMAPHDDDSRGQHDEELLDPHVWLAPLLIKTMARNVQAALVRQMPEHREQLSHNLITFEKELDSVDHTIRQMLEPLRGKHFFVFHPSWGYFANTYGLIQVPVEIEGKAPKPAQLKDLIEEAQKLKIKAIFVQPQFSTRSAQIIADAIGGRVITADPLAPDLLENLVRQAQAFKDALR